MNRYPAVPLILTCTATPLPPCSHQVILGHDGAMVNYPDMSGSTPLHAAVEAGNLDVLK